VLEEACALIRASAPDATETISYAKHIGFYPAPSGVEAFQEEFKPYKRGKGSVQFPLGQPMPAGLIRRIVEYRVEERTGRVPGGGRTGGDTA
jgi:uncharacterized protein YdhG (YjbR/CyaY superfamily)